MNKPLETHRNEFTQEQIEHLRMNHNVKSISASTIRFTEEFKRYFYEKIKSGMTSKEIFLSCGIDPNILGMSRIEGFRYSLNKKVKRDPGFTENRGNNYRHPPKADNQLTEARIKRLEHELAYTRQEVEFLKKLQMADMEARRQWESRRQPK